MLIGRLVGSKLTSPSKIQLNVKADFVFLTLSVARASGWRRRWDRPHCSSVLPQEAPSRLAASFRPHNTIITSTKRPGVYSHNRPHAETIHPVSKAFSLYSLRHAFKNQSDINLILFLLSLAVLLLRLINVFEYSLNAKRFPLSWHCSALEEAIPV